MDGTETRFDYARIRMATDHDVAQQRTLQMRELLELWQHAHPDQRGGGFEFRVFPGATAQERQYCVEIWGPLAEVVTFLDYEEWADRLMRLDVRASRPSLTGVGIRKLGQFLSERKGRLNVTTYASKGRSKMRGRSVGGIGLALGSHKSVFRASVYKRGDEPAAVEFQYSGQALSKCVATIHARRAAPSVDNDPWAALRTHVWTMGMDRFERAADVPFEDMLNIARGQPRQLSLDKVEQLSYDIEMAWQQLPHDARCIVAKQLGLDIL